MNRYQKLGLGMLAECAFSAVLASSALAAAEWLLNGAVFAGAIPASTSAEINFGDAETNTSINCSMILDGTVGPGAAGTITSVLTLSGTEVTAAKPLLCKRQTTCEEGTDVEFRPKGLPWKTRLMFYEGGSYENQYFSVFYSYSCLVLGIDFTNECTTRTELEGGTAFPTNNGMAGVEIRGDGQPHPVCTLGKETNGIEIKPAGLISSPEGLLSESK